ncbi:ribosomal protein S18 acetylase RimI-like enzyme [Amycolatopsis bartoniae]|nr:GNAT family N-acetyltransferase [Amycolatopsis bartoniae]MBB2933794.1 ribosomal protein S18 acetylase RimI-like enzyme [Amycolatopsis bartoniae]TVT10547.1 GNAT family N-acetyltransferase [Amycolatopsis bartoniae]
MDTEAIATAHAARLTGADPLLPSSDPFARPPEPVTVFRADANGSGAEGHAWRSAVDERSSDSLWRPLVEHRLTVRLSGPAPGEALAEILTRWDEHLSGLASPGDWETAAVVPRPSRDPAGSAELLRHGFAPTRVLAVRPADRLTAAGPPAEPGVRIRAAETADLDTATRLFTELQRYDSQFGLVTLRANAEELLRAELTEQLNRTEPTVWLAELYGRPLGSLLLEYPPETDWVARYVNAERVGYLASLQISEAAQSSGVGTALTAHAHQLFDEMGVDAVLLHHALASPQSTPFWYGHGYRPLWTYWYRRPAVR